VTSRASWQIPPRRTGTFFRQGAFFPAGNDCLIERRAAEIRAVAAA
jgi:hypothetical protein